MSSEIQFCPECSNLLYSKEDREHKQLIFLCRSCDYLQYADPNSAEQNCVDRQNYNFRSKEDVNSYIAQGLGEDPTLPRAPDWVCPKCPNVGAVFFQLPERVADDAMTLVFVCTNCTYYEVKGKESDDAQDDLREDNHAHHHQQDLDAAPAAIAHHTAAQQILNTATPLQQPQAADSITTKQLDEDEDEDNFAGLGLDDLGDGLEDQDLGLDANDLLGDDEDYGLGGVGGESDDGGNVGGGDDGGGIDAGDEDTIVKGDEDEGEGFQQQLQTPGPAEAPEHHITSETPIKTQED